ncbi:hypothetical protein ATN84_08320 [Paramesorhizobium deserti]|uniref:Heparan-alpha-glucosaminide N-acetyltransferase catalytic domain-containing protein n=1 Tax=Paramesorhizobium deserti TaxID=1494590 RepID=A0A135HW04_9HYPH|nr:DUF1624 domain-containing protein [Paramesorhizobium deserti]KXF77385.1 hypothetical protein ATN84_08320 [Paramesorhizobium deserti]
MQLEQTATEALPQTRSKPRLARIDIARGVALIAMAIYHTGWDFEFFGYLAPGTTAHGGWKLFARMIASSFLILVGFSLVLAHLQGIRWRPFGTRLAQITAAALAISLVTWFITPDSFVFFGILHQIALASCLGLLFLQLPIPVLLLAAAAVIAAPFYLRSALFDHPVLWWVGLSTFNPRSNDYVPLFPWFGAVLGGMALARLFQRFRLMPLLQNGTGLLFLDRPLRFIGTHSLAFYLVHQPVLIGCVLLVSQLFPPAVAPPEALFARSCEQSCAAANDAQFCQRFCSCVIGELEKAAMFDDVIAGRIDTQSDPTVLGIAGSCTSKSKLPGN